VSKEENKMRVLLEEIRGDVKLALEGHDGLRNEMRQMEGRLTEKIEENKVAIKFVAGKVNDIDKKLDAHIKQPAHVS